MENVIHGINGSLHILAVVTWIGSMVYSQLAVTPALNTSLGSMKSHALNGLIMKKFVPLTWISLIVLIATGLYAIFDKREKFTSWTDGPGGILTIKLVLVGVMVAILLYQVLVFGPKIKQLVAPSTTKDTGNEMEMARLENTTKSVSWWHLVLGLVIVMLHIKRLSCGKPHPVESRIRAVDKPEPVLSRFYLKIWPDLTIDVVLMLYNY